MKTATELSAMNYEELDRELEQIKQDIEVNNTNRQAAELAFLTRHAELLEELNRKLEPEMKVQDDLQQEWEELSAYLSRVIMAKYVRTQQHTREFDKMVINYVTGETSLADFTDGMETMQAAVN